MAITIIHSTLESRKSSLSSAGKETTTSFPYFINHSDINITSAARASRHIYNLQCHLLIISTPKHPSRADFCIKCNTSSSGWPQHACPECNWTRSVLGLTARSNPRLSLPFQSSNREKIGKRKGIIWQWWGVLGGRGNNSTYSFMNANNLQASCFLSALISIHKMLPKIYPDSRV